MSRASRTAVRLKSAEISYGNATLGVQHSFTLGRKKRGIGILVSWHILTGIMTRIARFILVKILVEMCNFTRIPMTRLNVSFVLQNFFQCMQGNGILFLVKWKEYNFIFSNVKFYIFLICSTSAAIWPPLSARCACGCALLHGRCFLVTFVNETKTEAHRIASFF